MSAPAPLTEQILKAQAGDKEECGRIVEENAPLIWSVARRFFGRGIDPDDLYQLGCIGMLKAIYGFDPNYGTMFSTYAVPKIAGEIRRFLRDDGMIKVSRQVKAAAGAIAQAKERLMGRLGREPYLSELAEETGMTPEEIAVCENAGAATSLQKEMGEDGMTMENALGVEGPEEEVLVRVLMTQAIACLTELEQKVIRLRFYKAMTQEQAARILSISQVQVSRLERRAIQKLRQKIG